MDSSEAGKVAGFHADNGFPWATSPGDPDIIAEYRVRSIPATVALDRDGVIVYKPRAGTRPEAEWRRLFEELAAGAASERQG